MWCQRPALSIVLMLFVATSLSAQTDCRQRTVPVTVFDRRTGQIIEPSVASFKATYRGKPVRVISVDRNQLTPRVILLLDVSGSMSPNMAVGLSLAGDLLSRLPQPADIGFVIFANKMERVVDLTNDRLQLASAVDSLERTITEVRARLGGDTALWDSVADSVGMFGDARVGDTIFAITDGEDNASRSRGQNTIANLASAGIRLFRVDRRREAVRNAAPSGLRDLIQTHALQEMIQETGGRTTDISLPLATAELPRVRETLDLQYRIIRNFSRLSVELPQAVRESSDWRLEIANVIGKNDLEVVYPRKLPTCK